MSSTNEDLFMEVIHEGEMFLTSPDLIRTLIPQIVVEFLRVISNFQPIWTHYIPIDQFDSFPISVFDFLGHS